MNFLRRKNPGLSRLRPQALSLYRQCLRTLPLLLPPHQKIWYDYVRLKYEEHEHLSDPKEAEKKVKEGREELDWLRSVIKRKEEGGK